MIHERLDDLSILSIESDKADEINLSEVAKQLAKFAKFHFCVATMQHISLRLFSFFINELILYAILLHGYLKLKHSSYSHSVLSLFFI